MGFVGPNGAGKSTTIRILMGMVRQERGSVRVLGRSMPRGAGGGEARRSGSSPRTCACTRNATLAWHMRFVASIYPDWDPTYADALLQRFNLHAEQEIKALSHGERVKATLLLVLARRPRLLLLDEPTTGLDPVARHEILAELMDVVRDERRAVLFSSHNTQDVEQISDQITFIDRGRIIDSSDKETFLDRWRRLHLDVPPGVALPPLAVSSRPRPAGASRSSRPRRTRRPSRRSTRRAGVTVRDVQRMTLEEIFVANVMSNRRETAGMSTSIVRQLILKDLYLAALDDRRIARRRVAPRSP